MTRNAGLKVLQPNGCAKVCCDGFEMEESPAELAALAAVQLDRALFYMNHKHMLVPVDGMNLHSMDEWTKVWFLMEHEYETQTGHKYQCRAWDSETGNCKVYDTRPQMCRDFPGPGGCDFSGCGMQG